MTTLQAVPSKNLDQHESAKNSEKGRRLQKENIADVKQNKIRAKRKSIRNPLKAPKHRNTAQPC